MEFLWEAGAKIIFATDSCLDKVADFLGEKVLPFLKDIYEEMWSAYFSSMAIDERFNEKCQNTLLPRWYRKHMLEFS